MEQLELFPIKREDVQSWLVTKAVKHISATIGKTTESVTRHVNPYLAGRSYLFIRYTDKSFAIIDELLDVATVSILIREDEMEALATFFTMEEMNYIRELQKDPSILNLKR